MTSHILNRFNIKTDRLLRSIATDKLFCDIHPRKMIKMVRRMSRDHIIMIDNDYVLLIDNDYALLIDNDYVLLIDNIM